jgi:hypothetical protein
MRMVNRMAAQGDFIIMKIEKLPEGLVPVEPVNGQHIVAHSETGHNHVMVAERPDTIALYKDPNVKEQDLYTLFAVVKEGAQIDHLRSFDTHESLGLPAGNYEIRRQREYTPEGFRRAAD